MTPLPLSSQFLCGYCSTCKTTRYRCARRESSSEIPSRRAHGAPQSLAGGCDPVDYLRPGPVLGGGILLRGECPQAPHTPSRVVAGARGCLQGAAVWNRPRPILGQ